MYKIEVREKTKGVIMLDHGSALTLDDLPEREELSTSEIKEKDLSDYCKVIFKDSELGEEFIETYLKTGELNSLQNLKANDLKTVLEAVGLEDSQSRLMEGEHLESGKKHFQRILENDVLEKFPEMEAGTAEHRAEVMNFILQNDALRGELAPDLNGNQTLIKRDQERLLALDNLKELNEDVLSRFSFELEEEQSFER